MLVLVMAVALLGCTVENSGGTEGTPPPGDAYVEVLVHDGMIEIPSSAPAGTISFEISNPDDTDHSLAIRGPGVDERLDDELDPIETRVLTVNLVPGTYTVWCPVADHRGAGEEAVLEVSDVLPETDDGTSADPGVGPGEEQAPIEDEGP